MKIIYLNFKKEYGCEKSYCYYKTWFLGISVGGKRKISQNGKPIIIKTCSLRGEKKLYVNKNK